MKKSNRFISSAAFVATTLFMVGAPMFTFADTLNRELSLGVSGADVSVLQTYLSHSPAIYPQGSVTGYFGNLTKAAVSNFQGANSIAMVGRVGPATLALLNVKIPADGNGGNSAIISNVLVSQDRNNATISWNTDIPASGKVYYSSNPLSLYENWNTVDVSGNSAMTDANFRNSQSVTLNNLQSNTTYYYTVYTVDQAGNNVSLTWPTVFATKI